MNPSLFDSNKFITQENWGVTLICEEGSHHAQICLEISEQENHFKRFIIHFQGPKSCNKRNNNFGGSSSSGVIYSTQGRVKVGKSHLNNVHYSYCSDTWLVPAEKVQLMIEQARKECDDPIGYPKGFTIVGCNSKFKPTVKAYKSLDPLVQDICTSNKSLFKWLFKTAEKTFKEHEKERFNNKFFIPRAGLLWGESGFNIIDKAIEETLWFDSYEYEAHFVDQQMSQEPIHCTESFFKVISPIERQFLKEGWLKGGSYNKGESAKGQFAACVQKRRDRIYNEAVDKIKNQFDKLCLKMKNFQVLKEELEKRNGDYIELYKDLLRHVHKKTVREKISTDNCFTWSREKLKMLDINLPVLSSEKWWANTHNYLQKKEN